MFSWRLIIYVNVVNCSIALYGWPVPLVIDRYNVIIVIFETVKAVMEIMVAPTDKNPEHQTDQHDGQYKFEHKWYEESNCTKYNPESYGF